ncbi:malate dehydrogenase [Candidatus Bathyarchaeota archaeon]|nr:MAG: malate dehydrogenase [Candidatus Bathyarchaeota archaeon]
MNKVSVIGAGNVGASTARLIVQKELADVVLVDIVEGLPQGKALDILESGPIEGFDSKIIGTNSYQEIQNSKVTVITAGLPRKPGMSRLDLLEKNHRIVKSVIQNIVDTAPETIIVMVTNPLDVMTYVAFKESRFKSSHVLGQAGVLDSSRFRSFIAMELGVSVEDVQSMVLGGHGDSMVPLPRYTTVSGIPIAELLSSDVIERLINRTRKAGGEIIAHLKTSSAYYSPAAAITQIVESILKDKKRIVPASSYLNGEYGLKNVYVGVPVKLGAQGVEEIIELELTKDELKALQRSAAIYVEAIKTLGY